MGTVVSEVEVRLAPLSERQQGFVGDNQTQAPLLFSTRGNLFDMSMTPHQFMTKWGPGGTAFNLNEEQGAQSHFLDLCELLSVPKPGSQPDYRFEEKGDLIGGKTGYADVFKRNQFAWENKAPGKNLDAALRQLLTYSLALDNPPLLVVCDRLTTRIHTQFNGHPSETHVIRLEEMDQPDKLSLLRHVWTDPESFRPRKTTRDITNAAAKSFATLAEQLRHRGRDSEQVAHFLTQCLFCFFAEDVGLLPGRMFERLVNNRKITSELLTTGLVELFKVMRDGGMYGPDHIPWFNGGLFKKIAVPRLEILDVTELRNAAALNWSAIDVSIFGTLFERGLDPAKRSQLGAHYTDPATIMRIIEPVLQLPLLQTWTATAAEIKALMSRSTKRGDKSHKAARNKFINWLDQLNSYRVLDPACGSGNFLFLGLKTLKDIEHKSHLEAAAMGLDREQDLVTGPQNMLGIELNEYAAELARVTVWIGELQWRIEHGYEFKTNPVLEPLDHIEHRDSLLVNDGGTPHEAAWPHATVVIGNPPFVGDKMMRKELGDAYTDTLRSVFKDRVPGGADLVMYWFEKARAQIETQGLGAAGLVATNSIRQRGNRPVMERIQATTRIYEAWADMPWVNDGAAVRVSLVCFGHASQIARLDGKHVEAIFPDLKAQGTGAVSVDLTTARPLAENADASYFGFCLAGPFKVPTDVAAEWLRQPNVDGQPNSLVLKPIYNGSDVTRRWSGNWTIDFGARLLEGEAGMFEKPFEYVLQHVKPLRSMNNRASRAKYWWRHGEARPGLRKTLEKLHRYIATVETAKHRIFVFFPASVAPEHSLIVIPRADDVTFGVLSSRAHVVWALARGGTLEDRPRYNSLATFEPFPFPQGLTPADTADQKTEALPDGTLIPAGIADNWLRTAAHAIGRAAMRLNAHRESWLNPPEWTQRVPEVVPVGMTKSPYPDRVYAKSGHEKDIAERTLTKLYNVRPAWLDAVHQELDAAVAVAYGWQDYTADMSDAEILKRLLALNLARSIQP